MKQRALNFHELHEKTKLARSTIFKLEKAGQFPKRRRYGSRTIRWLESEVDEWIESRPVINLSGGDS